MNTIPNKHLWVVEGPTAVGKTAFAIEWAQRYGSEILSADSRQFYQELRIGVARPEAHELAAVPHHFIAHLSIHDYYSVSRYEEEVLQCLEQLFQKNDHAVMVGGSGLYVQAVCQGIDLLPDPDPELREALKQRLETEGIAALQQQLLTLDPVFYQQIDLHNHKRLRRALEVCLQTGRPYSEQRTQTQKQRPFHIHRIALQRDKEELYHRINLRVDRMIEEGLIAEVESLFPFRHLNALNTVGYKEIFAVMEGKITLAQAIIDIKTHSRRYAKRQMTWLRAQEGLEWTTL